MKDSLVNDAAAESPGFWTMVSNLVPSLKPNPLIYVSKLLGRSLRDHGVRVADVTLQNWITKTWTPARDPRQNLLRTLAEFGVASRAIPLDTVEETVLRNIALPAIFLGSNGDLMAILDVDSDTVEIFSDRVERFSNDEMPAVLGAGTLIELDVSSTPDDSSYAIARARETWTGFLRPALLVVTMVLVGVGLNWVHSVAPDGGWAVVLIGLNVIGLGASAILVQFYIGFEEQFLTKHCRPEDGGGCLQVLTGGNSKLFGVPYADLGILYFASNIAIIGIGGVNAPLFLAGLVVGSAAMALSVLYQAFWLRAWCKYCLASAAGVFAQAVIIWAAWADGSIALNWPTGMGDFKVEIFAVAVIVILWSWLRALLASLRETVSEAQGPLAFVHEAETLEDVAVCGPEIAVDDLYGDLVIGPESAAHSVCLLVSTACAHCGSLVKNAAALAEFPELSFHLRVRFHNPGPEDVPLEFVHFHAEADAAAKSIMRLSETEPSDRVLDALINWYDMLHDPDRRKWSIAWGIDPDQIDQNVLLDDALTNARNWCKAEDLLVTPQVIIGGRRIHHIYRLYEAILMRRTLVG